MTGRLSRPDLVVAVDVGGTTIKGALIDRSGVIRSEQRLPTPVAAGPAAVLVAVESVAARLSERGGDRVAAAGVVVPGQVDPHHGIVRYAANLGLRDAPLRERVSRRLGVPVVLGHDVGAAGVAERQWGAARGVADALIVVVGTGIAAMLVSGRQQLVGAIGSAGELGHVPVRPGGERCACGQLGCLEVYASAAGIVRRYRSAGGADPGDRGAAGVLARIGTDPVAAEVWQDAIGALVSGLVTVTMLIDPELIVVGGGLSAAGADLLRPLRSGLAGGLAWRAAPRVELSPLGEAAGRLGAGVLAWRMLDGDPAG